MNNIDTATEPMIKRFSIFGLHGYKDVDLTFDGPTRIVIAENGSGKTTILNALSAFLKCNFSELTKITFSRIECELSVDPYLITIHRNDLFDSKEKKLPEELNNMIDGSGLTAEELYASIVHDEHDIRKSDSLRAAYLISPHDEESFLGLISTLRSKFKDNLKEGAIAAFQQVRQIFKGYQILYLPTYRRVELPRIRDRKAKFFSRRIHAGSDKESNNSSEIQFGLSDIEDRLAGLMGEIQRQSNIGYRTITANIIDDALSNNLKDPSLFPTDLPTIGDLSLFFSRLEGKSSTTRLNQLNYLYDEKQIFNEENIILRYFLGQLSVVMKKTREMESRIETFVEKSNLYLKSSNDEKELKYDANTMKVEVIDKWTNLSIPLNNLSSGEKQVISITAHMWLGRTKKIVLIDEPELSLSLDWQRRLLPDIISSPACHQLLAITHSPFIFDNDLDVCAVPLKISKNNSGLLFDE